MIFVRQFYDLHISGIRHRSSKPSQQNHFHIIFLARFRQFRRNFFDKILAISTAGMTLTHWPDFGAILPRQLNHFHVIFSLGNFVGRTLTTLWRNFATIFPSLLDSFYVIFFLTKPSFWQFRRHGYIYPIIASNFILQFLLVSRKFRQIQDNEN